MWLGLICLVCSLLCSWIVAKSNLTLLQGKSIQNAFPFCGYIDGTEHRAIRTIQLRRRLLKRVYHMRTREAFGMNRCNLVDASNQQSDFVAGHVEVKQKSSGNKKVIIRHCPELFWLFGFARFLDFAAVNCSSWPALDLSASELILEEQKSEWQG